jgi:guanylate kinase
MKGTLVLLLGPSGSGKGTLLSYVRAAFPQFIYPTSWTTRAPRAGEKDGITANNGKAYHFVSVEEFLRAKDAGFFLEWDRHFNNYYGTPAKEVVDSLEKGSIVFQEIEINGTRQVLSKLPRGNIKIVFITAGSWENLAHRIEGRETIERSELEKRRAAYEEEMAFSSQADFVLLNENGKLGETQRRLGEIVQNILSK